MTHLNKPENRPGKRGIPAKKHRWVLMGGAAIGALGMMTAFALVPSAPHQTTVSQQLVVEQLDRPATTVVDIGEKHFLREERILRSDTLFSLVSRLGISDPDAIAFLSHSQETQAIARQLRPGKVVSAQTGENGELIALFFPLNGKDAVLAVKKLGARFTASEQALALEKQIALKSGQIRHSLFGATDAAEIPDAIATQLAEIFAGEIDFYRDLRKGDRFSIVYEVLTHEGQPVRSGRILTAEFINNQKIFNAYWFEAESGKGGYYSADGRNLRKAFLRSPLEFSRVTSGFSTSRFHPVLQINRAHKGIDYGAPIGTKVRSVADGTVEFAGWQGGFGKLLIIRHQGPYSTAYGHLNGFATGIKKGAKVAQGETIGYTGQTGLSSGPHLHYEFRVNATQVNPQTIALPQSLPLDPHQIGRFKQAIEPAREQLALAQQVWPTNAE